MIIAIVCIIILLILCIVLLVKNKKLKVNNTNEWEKLKNYEQNLRTQEEQIKEKEHESVEKIRQYLLSTQESVNKRIEQINQQIINKQNNQELELQKRRELFNQQLIEKQNNQELELKKRRDLFNQQLLEKQDQLNQQLVNKQTTLNLQIKQEEEDANQQIEQIKLNLKYYEDLQAKVIQDALNKEKEIHQYDFYRVILDDNEKSDITKLESITAQLSKPEVVYKIIYEYYYKNKLNEMFNKILNDCPTKGGIYKITNIKDNRVYIGKAKDFKSRWRQHSKEAINCATNQTYGRLYDAMQKEGLDNFAFEVIDACDESLLDEREKYWITYYHSVEYGYNSKIG